MRKMTKEEKEEYDRLTKDAEQLRLEATLISRMTYGYARVSTKGQARDGNSLESQKAALKAAGATEIFTDAFTGTTTERPELDRLLSEIEPGDTLVVTKLDRMARSTLQGLELLQSLAEKGVTINILDMGTISNRPVDKLRLTMLLAFAEYERNMILERTRAGKEVARKKKGYREGRPPKFRPEQLEQALTLLDEGYSYRQAAKRSGVSVSTIQREKNKRASFPVS